MLHKKDFIIIAEILNDNLMQEEKRKTGFDLYILEQLCFYFKENNPQFDETKFREAVLK